MSQEISKPSILPKLRDSFPRTTKVFDWLGYVVQSTSKVYREEGLDLAQQPRKSSTVQPVPPTTLTRRINLIFDAGVLIARRSAELLTETEPAVLRLFLLLHLIMDLGLILLVVLILAITLIVLLLTLH